MSKVNIKDLMPRKEPTLDELYHQFQKNHGAGASIIEMFYDQLKKQFEDISQKDLIIKDLQGKLEHMQPNTKKVPNNPKPQPTN